MLYTLLAGTVILIAGFIGLHAIMFLWRKDWFLGWLRGMFGLSLLALAGIIGIVSYDIYSYKQILVDLPVATISFDQIEDQYFDTTIVDAQGNRQRFNLHGDQWQLDSRTIKWKGYFSGFDIKPAYRLDRLSGRYYDITKETTAKRSNFALSPSLFSLDVWRFINEHPEWFSVIEAHYGTANFVPMRNGAQYEITLTNTGLRTRPLNDVARKAAAEWK